MPLICNASRSAAVHIWKHPAFKSVEDLEPVVEEQVLDGAPQLACVTVQPEDLNLLLLEKHKWSIIKKLLPKCRGQRYRFRGQNNDRGLTSASPSAAR